LLHSKLKAETESSKYLNYLVEDDLREIVENLEGNPGCMVVVMGEEGTTVELKEGKVVIESQPMSTSGLNYCRVVHS
jgi:hypothetical protein